ncbi:HET-domain-containing protein [Daldinia decipiens]|uniref:HET-domain-containing protein n=1 Tax=Daldinia decipiens TaxID=326647 RepID=UPI0020C1BF07|nr:HET-domain-containing protein [Daldinia decipiens]KAI1660636.1 HET-domain-containing protein [Daldinia decipiens]
MRLIDVNTLELKEFFSDKAPPYAILSHTWKGDAEVTLQEWERAATDITIKRKEGYTKIVGACRRARSDGLQYLWCDTNCIDKSSSAELSEAINSMFAWYRDSAVCYACLHDVEANTDTFCKSHWFTRGWTLQELLAPRKVIFFDYRWTVLGDKSELAGMISDITRIHVTVLKDYSTIYDYSIAQRMSWAAGRETTRPKDIAYCLLGLFKVNMPLLYGEKEKAFVRLQREIIKVSDDQSILAWDLLQSASHPFTGALAASPSEFRYCGSIVRDYEIQPTAYSITNLGISINLTIITTCVRGIIFAGLNCARALYREAQHSKQRGGIQVRRCFPIWIALRHLKHDIFLRAHHPSSKLYLGNSYPVLARPKSTKLILDLDSPQLLTERFVENHIEILRRHTSVAFSGLHVTVAAGKMIHKGYILQEAYPLKNVSILQLKCRGTSAMSHHLISSGNISIILSIFWNEKSSPLEWLHTTILDPRLTVSSKMVFDAGWECLFRENSHERSTQAYDSIHSMRTLHNRLRQTYGITSNPCMDNDKVPIVVAEDQPLRDAFGQLELIVDVTFREDPNSVDP